MTPPTTPLNSTGAAQQSRAFLLAAHRSLEQRPLGPKQVQWFAVPAVVCLAFSIELGMKSLIMRHGQAVKTHDLTKLFGRLGPDVQARIAAATTIDRPPFDALLREHSRAFEDWRYIHENTGSAHVRLDFLRALASAVQAEIGQEHR